MTQFLFNRLNLITISKYVTTTFLIQPTSSEVQKYEDWFWQFKQTFSQDKSDLTCNDNSCLIFQKSKEKKKQKDRLKTKEKKEIDCDV